MTKLSEALKRIETSLQNQEAQPRTPPHGSTTTAGRLTTLPPLPSAVKLSGHRAEITATPQPAPATSARTSLPAGVSDGPLRTPPSEPPLRESREGQEELTRLLYQTFASQKTYGDKAEMMEFRDGMFQMVLAEYPLSRIREAFIEHVRRKPDLPTPSDIVNIINPLPPVLSASLYTSLKRKIADDGYYPLSDERAFLRAFEAQEMAKFKAHNGSD